MAKYCKSHDTPPTLIYCELSDESSVVWGDPWDATRMGINSVTNGEWECIIWVMSAVRVRPVFVCHLKREPSTGSLEL